MRSDPARGGGPSSRGVRPRPNGAGSGSSSSRPRSSHAGAGAVLDGLTLLEVTTAIFEEAGRVDPPALRSLDAVHIAAALDLGDDLEGLVTYDDRQADAAEAHGITVISPI